MDQSPFNKKKKGQQSCLFIYIFFFSSGINLSPLFSACAGTNECMNNKYIAKTKKTQGGLCARELVVLIKYSVSKEGAAGFYPWKGCRELEIGEMRSGSVSGWAPWERLGTCGEGVEQSGAESRAGACFSPGLCLSKITGSQNDLSWKKSSSHPTPSTIPGCPSSVQPGLEHSKGWGSHKLSEQQKMGFFSCQ